MSQHTPGPWDYVPSTDHHGPYVSGPWGGDICDCYVMSKPGSLSVRNGGDSKPIHHQAERADANARLIAAAPDMLDALQFLYEQVVAGRSASDLIVHLGDSDLLHAISKSLNAIEKATGEKVPA